MKQTETTTITLPQHVYSRTTSTVLQCSVHSTWYGALITFTIFKDHKSTRVMHDCSIMSTSVQVLFK